jgi:hypothetical protein
MVSAVRPSRPILRALLGIAAAFAVLLSGSAHAYADPSIAEIEQQIDAEWNKLEPATGARLEYPFAFLPRPGRA